MVLTHADGRSERAWAGLAEARTGLLLLLGDLGSALFLHRRGWFLLGIFLLCHALGHGMSPLNYVDESCGIATQSPRPLHTPIAKKME